MKTARLAVAAGSRLGSEAAATVARSGGNAVDACLASAIMAWVAEPFFASVGGSGFIAVRSPDHEVIVYDGNNAMPMSRPQEKGQGLRRVFLDYSNGMYTGTGGGSVAVPGVLAAAHAAWSDHGKIEWEALFEPAIAAARTGLGFPRTSGFYLSVTWDAIWSRYPAARALFGPHGRPLIEEEPLVQAELADSLAAIAVEGPREFYEGRLAAELADAIQEDGGLIASQDLAAYAGERRRPVEIDAFGWRIASNPPPAVGGAVLAHMLSLVDANALTDPVARLRTIIASESAAVNFRHDRYEDPGQIAGALEEALERVRRRGAGPESTTHSSAADWDGRACSMTQSNGYGAGLVIRGILLNNTLGEEELNPMGLHGLEPGSRCHSNMAPSIACGPEIAVALGSPGADRIVGAIAQTIIAMAVDGLSLADAVAAPRAHVAVKPEGELLCYEPGLPGERIEGFTQRPYDQIHMFFGGVQAASVTDDGIVDAAHDPRRSGASVLVF